MDEQRQNDLALMQRIELAPAKQRLELILESDKPESVVAAMEPMDVYLTLKEIGELDAFELFELSQPEQVRCMIDLECWHKDTQHLGLARKWISMLLQLEDERFLEDLLELDLSFVLLFLQRHVRVLKLDDISTDALESETPLFKTPDERYLVESLDDNERNTMLVNQFLQRVYRLDLEYFYKLLEGVYFELPSNLEEEAYQERVRRLADRGFPEYFEAIKVYSPLDPARFKPQARARGMYDAMEGPPPAYPMRIRNDASMLARALAAEAEDAKLREEINWDLALLSNQVLVADIVDFSVTENVRETLERIQATLNIGLEYQANGDLVRARRLLRDARALDLFRLGHSLLISYARRGRTMLRGVRLHAGVGTIDLLDSPLREVLIGLLADRPLWYEGQDEGGRHRFREFRDLTDVKRLELFLARLEGLLAVLRGLLGPQFAPLDDHELAGTNHADPGGLLLSTLFCTAAANLMLHQRFALEPLQRADLAALSQRLGDADEGLSQQVLADLLSYARGELPALGAVELERAGDLAGVFLADLFDELRSAQDPQHTDLRFLRSLIVKF